MIIQRLAEQNHLPTWLTTGYAELAEARKAEPMTAFRVNHDAVRQPLTMDVMIRDVRAYAAAHYETGGWDVLVECWEDADIEKEIGGARTTQGAIRKCAETLGVIKDYGDDIRATAF
jgi:hypothetical protein